MLTQRMKGSPCPPKPRSASAGSGERAPGGLSLPLGNSQLSPYRPTWTEGAEKGPQGVHLPCHQLITDFFLVLRWGEKALRKNSGLVFSWKNNNTFHWAPPLRICMRAPRWQSLCSLLCLSLPNPRQWPRPILCPGLLLPYSVLPCGLGAGGGGGAAVPSGNLACLLCLSPAPL